MNVFQSQVETAQESTAPSSSRGWEGTGPVFPASWSAAASRGQEPDVPAHPRKQHKYYPLPHYENMHLYRSAVMHLVSLKKNSVVCFLSSSQEKKQ